MFIIMYVISYFIVFSFFWKVIKVEESIHSYSAELEILDFAICKAKAMKVSQPDESPTVVQIDFEGATG